MASPQTENGFIKIANELMEKIYQHNFSSREMRIILAVIRFSYGFNKKSSELSLTFLSNATTIHTRHIQSTIKKLIRKNVLLIIREQKGTHSRVIQLNKNYENWVATDDQTSRVKKHLVMTKPVVSTTPESVMSTDDQTSQPIKTKDNINTKEVSFLEFLPEHLREKGFIEAFELWIDFRKEIKKKLNALTIKKQIEFLSKQMNPIACIETSIRNQWVGLFSIRENLDKTKKELITSNLKSINLGAEGYI